MRGVRKGAERCAGCGVPDPNTGSGGLQVEACNLLSGSFGRHSDAPIRQLLTTALLSVMQILRP